MSLQRIVRRALAAAAVGATALIAAPAAASVPPVGAAAPQASMTYECFGYTGTFMARTAIVKADWNEDGNPDECFGVAPNRHIYHDWRGHGWVEMPNHGLADNTDGFLHASDGARVIYVWVNGKGSYCSEWNARTPVWTPWTRCG